MIMEKREAVQVIAHFLEYENAWGFRGSPSSNSTWWTREKVVSSLSERREARYARKRVGSKVRND